MFDHNISDQFHCASKLKQPRRMVTPSAMDWLEWKQNRGALSTLIGKLVDHDTGVALSGAVDDLFERAWKEPTFIVSAADRAWVDLFRQGLAAAATLVVKSGAAKHQDVIATGDLVRAALTDDPSLRVMPLSLQNYPSLEANEKARNGVIVKRVDDRLAAAELEAFEAAHKKSLGSSGSGSGSGKQKPGGPPHAGDSGGSGSDADDADGGGASGGAGKGRSRNQRRRDSHAAHGGGEHNAGGGDGGGDDSRAHPRGNAVERAWWRAVGGIARQAVRGRP